GVNAHRATLTASVFAPTKASACFHRKALGDRFRQYRFPILLVLLVEQFPTRHRNYPASAASASIESAKGTIDRAPHRD
ncbi:MAG: hypothetical protein F6K28_59020, partial [Microcoleus sp. SIO2G3]|nr:hypothetical protein [Microcoleus sp. SIO2G3]